MFKVLENSLFVRNRERYDLIRKRANAFNANYTGSNIIQDDIFHIIENYVLQQDMHLELFRFPLGDDDFCACTFIRESRVFVVINTLMPLAKQIIAAAHELYHLYNYFEENDPSYPQRGSILDATTMDEDTTKEEDMEANAFAGAVLVPSLLLKEQMSIYRVRKESIGLTEILLLMEVFAVPYKAMVLRLFEEGIIVEDEVHRLLEIDEKEISRRCELTGRAMRWERNTKQEVSFGSLRENMDMVSRLDAVDHDRYQQDVARIREITGSITGTK